MKTLIWLVLMQTAESRMGPQEATEQNPVLGGPAKSQRCVSGQLGLAHPPT